MNAIIIDDERPARLELRRLLGGCPSVELIGEADSAAAGRELLARVQPDLVFLDIEMPEQNGFDFLETLEPPCPHVVFTTAYNAYAVRAFEVSALDYLLKPVHPRRLAAAVAKVERELAGTRSAVNPAGEPRTAVLGPDDHVFVRDGDRCWFVPVRSLILLEAEGNHIRIRFPEAAPMLYRTLNSMEARLPAGLFLRANRSQLVNTAMIESIEPWFSGALKAVVRGGHEVEFSRRQAQAFRERRSL